MLEANVIAFYANRSIHKAIIGKPGAESGKNGVLRPDSTSLSRTISLRFFDIETMVL